MAKRLNIAARTECLNWLFWQMGSAPYLGGGFGHFYAYAPVKIEYATNIQNQPNIRFLPDADLTHQVNVLFPWQSG
jgi:glutathione S-transferase